MLYRTFVSEYLHTFMELNMQIPSVKQQRIMAMAGILINEQGLKGLTIKNLAAKMQFTEGAIYRHFKTKEDIVVMLIEELYLSIEKRFAALPNEQNTCQQNLEAIFASHFDFFSKNRHFVTAILAEGLIDETAILKAAFMKIVQYKQNLIASTIALGKSKNQIKGNLPTDELVHIIMASFRMLLFKWKLSNFTIELPAEGAKLLNTINELIKR